MGVFDFLKNFIPEGVEPETLADNEPGTIELFERCLDSLLASETQEFITISGSGDTVVQVMKSGDMLQLHIAYYPTDEHPNEKLAELGILLPTGSEFSDWESHVYAMYNVPVSAAGDLAVVIDAIFCKLYGESTGYLVGVGLES